MKELLTYIVENLVSDPAAIAITEEINSRTHESGWQSLEQARHSLYSRLSLRGSRRSVNHFNLNEEPVPSGAGFFRKSPQRGDFLFYLHRSSGVYELRKRVRP